MSDPVFDEEISLRRLGVALKRADWRMFEQALARLDEEIAARSAFHRHGAWQELLLLVQAHEDVSDALKARLREALARLLSVETRVQPAPSPGEEATEGTDAGGGLVLVLPWRSSLDDANRQSAFRAWLLSGRAYGQDAARRLLLRWLDDEGATLSQLAERANLSLAAEAAGVALADPPWVDLFYAGLHVALGREDGPPLTCLADAAKGLGPVTLLVAEPSNSWERFFEAGVADAPALVKLAGSLDWFYCPRCHETVHHAQARPLPLAVACPGCAAPARPLIMPLEGAPFRPSALGEAWAQAATALASAATWVLVDPPAPGESPAFERWLAARLGGRQRILVVGGPTADAEQDRRLAAWQAWLTPRGEHTLVTSRGPADEVLGFLLQGGVPVLEPAAVSASVTFSPRKKPRR